MPTTRRNTRSPRTRALTALLFTGAIATATLGGPALAANAADTSATGTNTNTTVATHGDTTKSLTLKKKHTTKKKKTAAKPAPAPAPAPAAPAALPTINGLDAEQVTNAATIVKVGNDMGVGQRAEQIAIATAMQESKLYNLDVAVDHDSLGLFQQRPSSGWGTPAELNDPAYAAKAFLQVLIQDTSDYNCLTCAAQRVQVSAFPDAYAQWEPLATTTVTALNK